MVLENLFINYVRGRQKQWREPLTRRWFCVQLKMWVINYHKSRCRAVLTMSRACSTSNKSRVDESASQVWRFDKVELLTHFHHRRIAFRNNLLITFEHNYFPAFHDWMGPKGADADVAWGKSFLLKFLHIFIVCWCFGSLLPFSDAIQRFNMVVSSFERQTFQRQLRSMFGNIFDGAWKFFLLFKYGNSWKFSLIFIASASNIYITTWNCLIKL